MVDAQSIRRIVSGLHDYFATGATRPLDWRIAQLQAIHRLLTEHEDALVAALLADLGKCRIESRLSEIEFVKKEVDYTLKHLKSWLKPQRKIMPLRLQPATAKIVYEPLGTVLIMAPWNYPVMLVFSPLIGALAAGNTALVKPSELSPHVSQLLVDLVPQYLDRDAVRLVYTDVQGSSLILQERFDKIFYTGGSAVAKIVMTAAAKHLTPVTLELGGKSPVWVDNTVNIEAVAQRLVWAKFMNAGQTCIAPDYILTTPSVAPMLIAALRRQIEASYGSDIRHNSDYGRIIHTKHAERLQAMLDDVRSEQIVCGGEIDVAARYIAPTIIDQAGKESRLMQEEIFGPILPIVHVSGIDEAIDYIRQREKPLALYAFTDDTAVREKLTEQTSSGAISFNAAMVHIGAPNLPFGGVGNSGMGQYIGQYSLETFSHRKSVLSKPLFPNTLKLIAPPYPRWINWILKYFI